MLAPDTPCLCSWKPLLPVCSQLFFLQVSDSLSLPRAPQTPPTSPPLNSTLPAAQIQKVDSPGQYWDFPEIPPWFLLYYSTSSYRKGKTCYFSHLLPIYLPHTVVPPVSSSLSPVSSDSITRTPSFCPVKPLSVLLNPSRSDGTAEVPKADACCPAALETEESGQGVSHSSVPAHGGRILSVEVSPQPLPLSSESALQLYPGTQNSLALGYTQVSYS